MGLLKTICQFPDSNECFVLFCEQPDLPDFQRNKANFILKIPDIKTRRHDLQLFIWVPTTK
jgi:hypothetical protein